MASIDDIGDIEPRRQYTASASQTAFDYPFPIFDEADLRVDVDGVTQVLTTNYTVSGVGNDTGGTVTFVVARTAGQIVTIWRDTAIQRNTDYQQNGPLRSSAINDDFDRLTIIAQELESRLGRALQFPVNDTISSGQLAAVAARKGKFLFFDATTGALDYAAAVTPLTAVTQSIVGGVLYPVSAAETSNGATIVAPHRPYGDFVRYGLSTSASSTVNANAINKALLSNSYCYCDDAGTYVVNSTLLVQSNQTIRLAQGVVIQGATQVWSSQLVHITGVSNVRIFGGTFDGNKAANPTGVLFGILMRDASDVKLFGVTCQNFPSDNTTLGAAGDGFYIGGNSGSGSTDIDLIGCKSLNNVRQGLSIVRCRGVNVVGGEYSGTTGNNPGAGIDVEANPGSGSATDVNISGVYFRDNNYGVVLTESSFNVTVTGCNILASRSSSIQFADVEGAVVTGNVIAPAMTASTPIVEVIDSTGVVFANNYIVGTSVSTEGAGVRFLGGTNFLINSNVFRNIRLQAISVGNSAIIRVPTLIRITNNTFLDCVDPAAGAGIAVVNVAGNTVSGIYPLFVHINNNVIRDTRSGGNEADIAINVSTGIPAATQQDYRIGDNFISGPAAVYTGGAFMPMTGGVTWNPADLADGAGETSPDITVLGAVTGDAVEVYPPYVITDCVCTGYVKSSNTVVIRLQNESGAANFNGISATWKVRVRKLNQA